MWLSFVLIDYIMCLDGVNEKVGRMEGVMIKFRVGIVIMFFVNVVFFVVVISSFGMFIGDYS